MRTIIILLLSLWPLSATAADCALLKDSRYTYDFSGDQPTIVGYTCQTKTGPRFEGSLYSDSEIRCDGINPVGISFAQGELYSLDMVSNREELLVPACN